jgi:beta-glucosidase
MPCSAWTFGNWLTRHVEARKAAADKAKTFVAQLDTVEKVGLVTGNYGYSGAHPPCVGSIAAIDRLGFDGLCFADGPTEYGRTDGTSVFPSGITVAVTWDSDLMYDRAFAMGEEFRAKGAHSMFGYVQPHAIFSCKSY